MKTVVGLDLGTSNCAWAIANVVEAAAGASSLSVRHLRVQQWVEGRRKGSSEQLPSVLYRPREGELFEGSSEDWIVGRYARERDQETVGRGIVSAKSWLCHSGVNRLEPLLPWQAGASVDERLSPVAASTLLLKHLKDEFLAADPKYALDDTEIVLTVPASFDPVARQLTVQAAAAAGLAVSLLEEPQAAFYDYLHRHSPAVEALLGREGSSTVLVCDVGGGTLDLSLIDIKQGAQQLSVSRRAVGRHLLLGGDNMDLALAHWVAPRICESQLSVRRMGQLVAACRQAKECLLGVDPPLSTTVRLLAEGAEILGGGLSLELRRADVEKLIVEGFFPLMDRGELPRVSRSGLALAGLPYEREPAITFHIAQFLNQHSQGAKPSALLLNGGVAASPVIVSRLLKFLRRWQGSSVVNLPGADVNLAVSRGAALHGLSLLGHGQRIEGGAARGLYMGLGRASEREGQRAVCVIPRGAREAVRYTALGALFELRVGVPARFELYATSTASHSPGAIVGVEQQELTRLPPLTTTVSVDSQINPTTRQVKLEGELTAIGTLELYCTLAGSGEASGARHLLEFELNRAESTENGSSTFDGERTVSAAITTEVRELLTRVFGKKSHEVEPREVKELVRSMEKCLGLRKTWSASCARAIVDCLLEFCPARLRSEVHERLFWSVVSYCLRPGFGAGGDASRVEQLWALFPDGIKYRKVENNWSQFWIAWRRLAGGLNAGQQAIVWQRVCPFVAPAASKLLKPKGFKPLALAEMLEMASQLERLAPRDRAQLGGWILERTWTERDARLWQCLGWIGARVPVYGDIDNCVDRKLVARWLEQLLMEQWQDVSSASACAVALCRVTGDARRDLTSSQRVAVEKALRGVGAKSTWIEAVQSFVPMTASAKSEQHGEKLPPGLSFIQEVTSAGL